MIWGSLLTRQGKFEEGLEKYKKVLEQTHKKESIAGISNVYSSIGNCYRRLGKNEMAMNYLQQAIKVDTTASRTYFNLALVHLSGNDLDQFFEVLEKHWRKDFKNET